MDMRHWKLALASKLINQQNILLFWGKFVWNNLCKYSNCKLRKNVVYIIKNLKLNKFFFD